MLIKKYYKYNKKIHIKYMQYNIIVFIIMNIIIKINYRILFIIFLSDIKDYI